MKKWIVFWAVCACLGFSEVYAADWTDCGTDAKGNTANCQYKIDANGTLTIRGVGNNGNVGEWDRNNHAAPWTGQGVTNIVIENSIKDVGSQGFSNMTSETPIVIPNGVQSIGKNAFYGVRTPEVVIPNSVTSIKTGAFNWCYVSKVDIPSSVTDVAVAFRGAWITDLIIPGSVTSLATETLSSCHKLETLTISDSTQLGAIFQGRDTDSRRTDLENLKIYCVGNQAQCDANLAAAGYSDLKSIAANLKTINGMTYVTDKKGHIVAMSGSRTNKRIYTVEEANMVSGKTNTVKIRYK